MKLLKYLTAITALFFSFRGSAQENERIVYTPFATDDDRKGYIGISLGPSLPLGDYISKDPGYSKAGLASAGAFFDVLFAYRVSESISITALLRGQSHPLNTDNILYELSIQNPGVDYTIDTTPWGTGGLMAGILVSRPLNARATIALEARGMVGYTEVSSPKIRITGRLGTSSAWKEQESASSGGVSYLLGTGLRFNLSEIICLLATIDVSGVTAEFKNVKTISSQGTYVTSNFSQQILTSNIGAGVAFRLK